MFLTVIAVIPIMLYREMKIPYAVATFFGGTSMLIMVGVMLDTMRQMESHLLMRHYDGFLKKGRLRGGSSAGPRGRVAMMIILKTERDLEAMRPACAVAGAVLDEVAAFIQPGVTTAEWMSLRRRGSSSYGAQSAFLGYRKYPCHLCISVNEQVVHGLAGDRRLQVWGYRQPGCGRGLQRVYRGHGADGGGGRLRCARRSG